MRRVRGNAAWRKKLYDAAGNRKLNQRSAGVTRTSQAKSSAAVRQFDLALRHEGNCTVMVRISGVGMNSLVENGRGSESDQKDIKHEDHRYHGPELGAATE